MIGVDTNVLVRFLVNDDVRQGALARALLEQRTSDDPAFVSTLVVAELVWALDQIYAYSRSQILSALRLLLGSANVRLEREALLKMAIGRAEQANADIADSIIEALSADAGCSATFTFDRQAAKRIPGMELLA